MFPQHRKADAAASHCLAAEDQSEPSLSVSTTKDLFIGCHWKDELESFSIAVVWIRENTFFTFLKFFIFLPAFIF